jgi:glycosyltransferase involved in cell wall biosynthesis
VSYKQIPRQSLGTIPNMKICALIPVHNESQEIGGIVKAIKGRKMDVLVVDDGSSDDSGHLAQRGGAVVIRNETRKGKGRSLQTGFDYILQEGYDGVVTLDGDGQHAPEDLDSILPVVEKNPQSIITGNRMQNSKGMPFVRWLTNYLMSWLISCLCRQKIPDSQCGYRYIPREALQGLSFVSGDFEIETEVLIKASQVGYPIVSIPVRTIYRNEKSKISPLKDTCRFLSYLFNEMTHHDYR